MVLRVVRPRDTAERDGNERRSLIVDLLNLLSDPKVRDVLHRHLLKHRLDDRRLAGSKQALETDVNDERGQGLREESAHFREPRTRIFLRPGSSPGGGKGERGLEGSPLDAGAVDMTEREMFVSGVIYSQRRNAGLEMGRQWFGQENEWQGYRRRRNRSSSSFNRVRVIT